MRSLRNQAKSLMANHPDLFSNDGWDTAGATGAAWSYPEVDWLMLDGLIRSTGARKVLELGSGRSTVLIARTLHEVHGTNFEFTSMEEDKFWMDQTADKLEKLLSIEALKNVKLVFSPKVNCEFGMFSGTCYENVPAASYDLIYVDGPDTDCKVNLDAVKLLEKSDKKMNILIDGRFKTAMAYRMLLPKAKFETFIHHQTIIRNVDKSDLNLKYNCHDVLDAVLAKKAPSFLSGDIHY